MASSLKNARAEKVINHEGGKVNTTSNEETLRRSVLACLLWEDTFYESGEQIQARIQRLVPLVSPEFVANLAITARKQYNLRHIPLQLAVYLAKLPNARHLIPELLNTIIGRVDELVEFMALYWKVKKCPIANSVKKGLAKAFLKFDEYQFAKYNRDKTIKLRDVMFLVHPKPETKEQEVLFKKIATDTLDIPYTWEVELSKPGADKKKVWTDLLVSHKLGSMALLKNLRNMVESDVDTKLVRTYIDTVKSDKLFPYRFISAAKHAPKFVPELENMMLKNVNTFEKFPGKTLVLVDTSGSMDGAMAGKSTVTRREAAAGIAIMARELCEEVAIYAFENRIHTIPPYRGFALGEYFNKFNGGTDIPGCLSAALKIEKNVDRIIIITDEQSHDGRLPSHPESQNYIINIAPYENGIGYKNNWTTITGWSDASLRFIKEIEK